MANKRTIGELIENEVRKQQIPITEFAKMICCQRNNVYDIFKRSKMDIAQLKQISKERMLTYSEIDQICMNESTEKVQVQIPAKKLKQYFPESYSKAQIEEVIFMLLASWAEKQ